MEYEKIKQLMNDMGNSNLTSIDIDFPDGTKISMKKDIKVERKIIEDVSISEEKVNEVKEIRVKEENKAGNIVKSPMVGTFYSKPSPNSDPYVELNKEVNKGDTLCIIEAMKLMNEIESEFAGKITEILVKDGDMVEYGTPLFRIEGDM